MDKKLENMAYDFSESDAELFDSVYAKLDRKAKATDDEKRRVLSSAMRKAGFEMNETNAKITMRKSRTKKIMICGIAAAALISAVGWTAATGGFERVKEYFAQDMSPYAEQINQTAKIAANDDITLSVDGVIADEVQCRVVVSVIPKTKRGEEIVGQLSYSSHGYLDDCYELQQKSEKHGDTDEEKHEWYVEQVKKLPPHRFSLFFENAGRNSGERFWEDMSCEEQKNINYDDYFAANDFVYYDRNNKYHFYDMFTIEMSDLDRSQPLILHETETGLSVNIDLNDHFDSHRLVSDDPMAFNYVVISPLAVYIRSTQNDIDNGRLLNDGGYNGGGELTSVTVNYTDGTSEELDNITIGKSAEDPEDFPEFDTEQEKLDYIRAHWDDQIVTNETLEAGGEELFELDRIDSVTIDGVTYQIS